MQPYKRKRRTRRDMIVLGGWLFADLLLGLAMLFAVANTVGQEPPTPTPTSTPNELQTAEANLARSQAQNQQTVDALEDQIAQADTAAQQTQAAADEAFARATELANEAATREAMSADQRSTADARATEQATSAQATISALATEQASSDSSVADLNNALATSVAQATEIANTVNAQSTEQAALAAVATENANAGVNNQATTTAAQNQVATSQAQSASAQSQIATSQAQSASAQATVDAAAAQIGSANATAAALEQQVQLNSLNPTSVQETIQVDLGGVIAGDGDAVEEARQELNSVLAPYVRGQNCRIGFVNISSRSSELGQGVQLSDAIAGIIEQDFQQLLPEPTEGGSPQLASESIALPGTDPVGEVQLQLFLSAGCQPAG